MSVQTLAGIVSVGALLVGFGEIAMSQTSQPGNVRELRNVLERAAILSDEGVITRRDLSLQMRTASGAVPTDLAAMECQAIENVLNQTQWNKSKAAKELGLTRTQLYVRLRKYGLENAQTP